MRKNDDYVWIRSDGMVFGLKTRKNCLQFPFTDLFLWLAKPGGLRFVTLSPLVRPWL